MCVIVHIGAKKSISRQLLQNCYDNNAHGWGIMWAHNDKLTLVKDVSSFTAFYNIWRDVPRDAERAVHFRIRTAGEINKANCHPFSLNDNLALMHNGMITTNMIADKMSDTFNYCEYELKPVIAGWPGCIDSKEFEKLVEEATGYSKLLFMSSSGKVMRVRPNMWTERNGNFFSNAHSLETKYIYNRSTSYNPDNKWEGHNYGRYDDLDSTASASDLYSGNKTDAEGQRYLADLEDRRLQDLEDEKNDIDNDIIEETRNELDDEPIFTIDFEDLLTMPSNDKLDWVQDYPQSAVYVIEGLLDTLAQAGIMNIDLKKIDVSDNTKSVVNG